MDTQKLIAPAVDAGARDKKLDRDLHAQLMNEAFKAFDGDFKPRPAKETVRTIVKAIAAFYEERQARAALSARASEAAAGGPEITRCHGSFGYSYVPEVVTVEGATPCDTTEESAPEPIYQVWSGDRLAWLDASPEYYSKRSSTLRRIVYTAPPARKVMTDEWAFEILKSVDPDAKRLPPGFKAFWRAIIAVTEGK